PPSLLKAIANQVAGAVTSKGGPTIDDYKSLLMLLFELFKLAKSNPMAIEPHVENPKNSDIFKKYPAVLRNHHAIHFLCDTLKVQLTAAMSPYDLEDLMDTDIEASHQEEALAVTTVTRIGDAMPGLGIVAAVLGVVITMGKLTQGKEVIGHSVAAALVGTFLGILASYGFMQPLGAKMESNNLNEGKFLSVIKAALIAYAKNCAPKVCVEFGRRSIPPVVRPSFEEIEKAASNVGKK
ncbi:MAG: MotA/TolQ/ExbB proton channel family protein, partial [Bdellovibrionia bacterium]